MNLELTKKLIEKYPQLFADTDKPATDSLMCFGCECGDGWFNIIDMACALIAHHIEHKPEKDVFRWVQIKEKYGTLRLYLSGHDEYIAGVIDMAEALSSRVCEVCGCPGSVIGAGWLMARCDSCAQ